jgi:uncharacterized protein
MKKSRFSLSILPQKLAICQLGKNTRIPAWVEGDRFFSVTKTDDELSIVCSENRVPKGIKAEKGWRTFKVECPLDFALTGILASLSNPLAKAGISLFAISTFDTDYLLVKSDKLEKAVKALSVFCNIRK